ncbi:hypothetical protein Y1Q_0009936 [Alligator mississippiensis]|uniref:Uncharacterized protein n=1 Tax=Alligator mississippiensis TaxID=8496 RepID=A0A151MXC6_ALLMI|nr:hypothetical protein Y1Q_0009936 [Alligator mississippiensis]
MCHTYGYILRPSGAPADSQHSCLLGRTFHMPSLSRSPPLSRRLLHETLLPDLFLLGSQETCNADTFIPTRGVPEEWEREWRTMLRHATKLES